ncbi:MAG: hypothetical protein WCR31_00395 [Treponema sp.]
MKKNIVTALFFCLTLFPFFSEGTLSVIPGGYGGITLGMSLDEVKDKLMKNSSFGYHGDRDVSLLPGENRILIETDSAAGHVDSFLERCYFQFYNNRLYIIIININTEKIDHYSVFSTLCKKYGDPVSLSPEKSVWKNNDVTMSLERPLSLKYVDNKVFAELNNKSLVQKSGTEMTQDMFLEGL